MRHYLNLRILWSVWTEFDLIPEAYRSWTTEGQAWWLWEGLGTGAVPKWMRCVPLLSLCVSSLVACALSLTLAHAHLARRLQIFAPILALQLVNAFWTYLILRILVRILSGKNARDVREEDEDAQDARELAELEAREKEKKERERRGKGGKAQ